MKDILTSRFILLVFFLRAPSGARFLRVKVPNPPGSGKDIAEGKGVLLAKSKRASERLLESSTKYLEEKMKLTKNNIDDINKWLYHRIRMCIWKQWKKPKTKIRNLIKMGVPEDLACQAGNSRRGHWFTTHTIAVNMAMTKERLINSGFYDLATAYQSVHVNY